MERSAVVSECGTYRYRLDRRWADGPAVVWVLLNPSTADAAGDDATVRRCLALSAGWGMGALTVVNLFALRARDPRRLRGHPDPAGPRNDAALADAVAATETIVVAWGAAAVAHQRGRQVLRTLGARARCLGLTADGHPRHPLYARRDTPARPLPA